MEVDEAFRSLRAIVDACRAAREALEGAASTMRLSARRLRELAEALREASRAYCGLAACWEGALEALNRLRARVGEAAVREARRLTPYERAERYGREVEAAISLEQLLEERWRVDRYGELSVGWSARLEQLAEELEEEAEELERSMPRR